MKSRLGFLVFVVSLIALFAWLGAVATGATPPTTTTQPKPTTAPATKPATAPATAPTTKPAAPTTAPASQPAATRPAGISRLDATFVHDGKTYTVTVEVKQP